MARFEMSVLPVGGGAAASAGRPIEAGDLFEQGLRCSAGRGCAADLVAAHMWFNLAAAMGHADARVYRTEIARELSRAEIATAQRRARNWLAGRRTS